MIKDFISEFRDRKPQYDAWGRFVTTEIMNNIKISETEKKNFLKIPALHRIKTDASIHGKVERFGIREYHTDIVDLLGVRFVVLLITDLELLENSIKTSGFFQFEKVRDFGVQVNTNPELFEYQSIHYLVRPNRPLEYEGISIGTDVVCEVQIRTLLQHAYAELTHDNIYKPVNVVPPMARRFVARSIALMETTDEFFCNTLESLRIANGPRNNLYSELRQFYSENVHDDESSFDQRTNFEIIELFSNITGLFNCIDEVKELFVERDYLWQVIRERRSLYFIYTQPIILLLYFLVLKHNYKVKERWAVDKMRGEVKLIFSDLGKAIGGDE